MPQARTVLVGALIVSSLMALWGWSEVSRYKDLSESETRRADTAEAAVRTIRTSLRKVESNYATSELRLKQVLAAVPDRATPVPVYNELCRRANCAKLDSLPTSAD